MDGEPVLWVQFGINHVPRVEDWPVMPCETLRVVLRPVNFFAANPGLDVPPSVQEVNQSVLLNGMRVDARLEVEVGEQGELGEVKDVLAEACCNTSSA